MTAPGSWLLPSALWLLLWLSLPAGVQALLDGVSDYLPCPTDVPNTALDLDNGEQALTLPCRWVGVCVGGSWRGGAVFGGVSGWW